MTGHDKRRAATIALIVAACLAYLVFHTLLLPLTLIGGAITQGEQETEQCDTTKAVTANHRDSDKATDVNESIAKTALDVARQKNATERATLALFQAGLVESGFRNLANDGKYGPEDRTGTPSTPAQVEQAGRSMRLPNDGTGTDHTSMGFLQQQIWWGTPQELMDPAKAAELFIEAAQEIENETPGTAADLAQAVQRSGPNAYASVTAEAKQLLDRTQGEPGTPFKRGTHDRAKNTALAPHCDKDEAEPKKWDGDLGRGEWTNPLPGGVATSPFGRRNISSLISWVNDHQGVDIATPGAGSGPGGLVVAPTDMTITFAQDDVHSFGGKVLGKERGDDPDFIFGFYHLHDVRVEEGDELERGDVLGVEGAKGEFDMATHLHFEIFKPGSGDEPLPYEGKNLDPEPILKRKGAWPE